MRYRYLSFLMFISFTGLAQEVRSLPQGTVVLPITLDPDIVKTMNWEPGIAYWVTIAYFNDPNSEPIHIEPAEQVWWFHDQPVIFLGAAGEAIPAKCINRGVAWVQISEGDALLSQELVTIYPRKQLIRLTPEHLQVNKALAKALPGVDAGYLAQAANFLAGNLANLDVQGTSYTVSGYGAVINSSGEWTGEPVPGNQNLFETVQGDIGLITANSLTETLTIAGSGIVTTSVTGDVLTVDATEVDGDETNELQNLFATVTSDSGSTTANSQTDMLSIVGTGSVSTSVSGDTLTIAGNGLTTEQDGDETNELQNLFATVTGDSGSTTANSQTDMLSVVGTGSVSTSISGDTLTIAGSGLTSEVDGDSTNELQDLFQTVTGDSGNTVANTQTDTLTIAGGTGLETSVAGDTLSVNVVEDGLDFSQLADAMTLDATTTVDFDTNGADLNLDGNTLVIDGSENRVGIGTASPTARLHVDGGVLSNGEVGITGRLGQSHGPLTTVASVDTGIDFGDVFVSENFAYARDFTSSQLRIYDIADPTNPVFISATATINSPFAPVLVVGNYLYSSHTATNNLRVHDISEPANPQLVASYATASGFSFTVSGHILYFCDFGALELIDITNPASPVQLSSVSIPRTNRYGEYQAGYFYLANLNTTGDTFQVIDVNDPRNPSVTDTIDLGGSVEGIDIVGAYAYVLVESNSLRILDISDPTSVTQVASATFGAELQKIDVSGRYAYVLDITTNSLLVLDVGNPTVPRLVQTHAIGARPSDVFVKGRYAFVTSDAGMHVIDLRGTELSSLEAHAAELGLVNVKEDASVQGQLYVTGGASIGRGGLVSDGDVGINGVFTLTNVSAPTASLADRVFLYAEDVAGSSEFKVRDEAGNVTTLSPHNFSLIGQPSEPLAWSYYSEQNGKKVNVDMLRAIRLVEELSGEQLVHLEGVPNNRPIHSAGLTAKLQALQAQNATLAEENKRLAQDLTKIKQLLGLELATQ